MADVVQDIRDAARKVLESGEVSQVIGWAAGSMPFKTTPAFITKPEDVDKLVWNPACVNNPSVYLPRLAKDKKVGIIAKPCDIRSIVALIQEKQIPRENLYVIGLNCRGVVDAMNLDAQDFHLQDVTGLEWNDKGLNVTTTNGSYDVECSDCLRDMCNLCDKRTPAMFDVQFGEAVEPVLCEVYDVPGMPEERRAYWAEQFSRCIRCYACRQVCPSCYCKQCFADRIEPKWTARKATTDESWMFHSTRSMHLVGRCVQCGECERACPMNIPIAQLNREMAAVVKDRYNFEPGDPNAEGELFGTYNDEDFDPGHHAE